MTASHYSDKCERSFRRTLLTTTILLVLPPVMLILKADYYSSVFLNSHIVLHLCHFLKTVVPSAFNLIFLIAAAAFIILIPTGFLRSIFHLSRGLTFPPFLKPFLSQISTGGSKDNRRVMDYEVVEIDSHVPFALAGGIVDKKIITSRSLKKLLKPEEYDAVLMHEAGHLKMNHPLKRILMSSILSSLFIIPWRKDLSMKFRALTELSADEFAVKEGIEPTILASAIVKAAKGDQLVQKHSISGFTSSQVRERIGVLLGIDHRSSRDDKKGRKPRKVLKTVPALLFLIFLIQPFLHKPDTTFCINHGKSTAWHSLASTMLSVCTEMKCERCDICSPVHREQHKTSS